MVLKPEPSDIKRLPKRAGLETAVLQLPYHPLNRPSRWRAGCSIAPRISLWLEHRDSRWTQEPKDCCSVHVSSALQQPSVPQRLLEHGRSVLSTPTARPRSSKRQTDDTFAYLPQRCRQSH